MNSAILKINDETTVELKYTALRAEKLENELDDSLLHGLTKADRAGVVVKYIAFGADVSTDKARGIFDEFIENGGTVNDISNVIVEALENGGFISKEASDALKKIRETGSKALMSL